MTDKLKARLTISIVVEYDPDVTNPEALCASMEAVASNLDVHAENGCGDIEIKSVRAPLTPEWFTVQEVK